MVWVSAILYVLGQSFMMWTLPDLGPELFQLQITTSWEAFEALQGQWTDAQWAQYRAHFAPDFVFPWLYGLFLFTWLLNQTLHRGKTWRLIWPLPWLAAIADCIENGLHLYLMSAPTTPEVWVAVSGSLSIFKWSTGFLLAGGLMVLTLVNRLAPPDQD
tara:strand:- start:50 stop:526 length:477 start_codon:yes stop_codon:yes gene_type:complete